MKLYRQGDVLFRRVASLPKGTNAKRANYTVAYGEVTGHSHQVAVCDRDGAEVIEVGDGLFMRVTGDTVSIVHEEHLPITLPTGNYEITIQREYSPAEIRDVLD